jgi:hypothetical protein
MLPTMLTLWGIVTTLQGNFHFSSFRLIFSPVAKVSSQATGDFWLLVSFLDFLRVCLAYMTCLERSDPGLQAVYFRVSFFTSHTFILVNNYSGGKY